MKKSKITEEQAIPWNDKAVVSSLWRWNSGYIRFGPDNIKHILPLDDIASVASAVLRSFRIDLRSYQYRHSMQSDSSCRRIQKPIGGARNLWLNLMQMPKRRLCDVGALLALDPFDLNLRLTIKRYGHLYCFFCHAIRSRILTIETELLGSNESQLPLEQNNTKS